jgi:hypothetical protein
MTANDHIRYDILAQDALRGVVRTVLMDTARNGLPGDHHFCISFDTRAEGVKMSPRLKAQHPEDITIILQHQFWDLVVKDDHFEVGVSFGGVPERLTVPFAAIKGFLDPSVQFELQFATVEIETEAAVDNDKAPAGKAAGAPAARSEPAADPAPAAAEAGTARPTGEVVHFDRFRKK